MPRRTIRAADGTPYLWDRSSAPTPDDHAALARFRAWTQKGGPVPADVDPAAWVRRRRDYLLDRRRAGGPSPALDRELALQNERLGGMRELHPAEFHPVPNAPPKPSGKRAAPPSDPATAPAGAPTPKENARRKAPLLGERRLLHDQIDAVRRSVPVYDAPQTEFLRLLNERLADVDRALAPGGTGRAPSLSPALAQRLKSQINFSSRGLDRADDAAKNAIPTRDGGVDYALEKRLKANSMALLGWKAGPKTAPSPVASSAPASSPATPAAKPQAAKARVADARTQGARPTPSPSPAKRAAALPVSPAPNRPPRPRATSGAAEKKPVAPNAVAPQAPEKKPGGKKPASFVPFWMRPEPIAPNDAPPLVLAPDHPLIAAKNLKGLDFDPVVFRQAVLQGRNEIPTHLVDADNVARANEWVGPLASDADREAQRQARESPYRTLNVGAASVPVARALALTPQDGDLLDPESRAFAKLTAAVRAGGGLSKRRDDLRAQVAESGGSDALYPMLRRDPDIGNATTAGLVGRAVSAALAPASTARVLLGDSRRDDEIPTVEGYAYGFADLIVGGFGSLAEKGAVGLGKLGANALRRAAATGFLEGAARQAVERGFARAMASQASRSLGRKVLRRAWGAAVENGALQAAPVVGEAADRTEANGRPFLQNLRETGGEAGRGFARMFDPRTLFDRDATPQERAMAALNLGLLLFGAGAKGYGAYRERARRSGVDPRYVDLVVRAGQADGERAGRSGPGHSGPGHSGPGGPGPSGDGPATPDGVPPKARGRKEASGGGEPPASRLDRLADELYARPPIVEAAPDPGGLGQITAYLFGRPLDQAAVADLAGAPGGSTVRIETTMRGGLSVAVLDDALGLDIYQKFQRSKGSTSVYTDVFMARKAPEGTGLVIFDRQVRRSVELGIDHIELSAVGDSLDHLWNGYYTWPRFGFNRELNPVEIAHLKREGFDVRDLHELFQRDNGPDWWRKFGLPGEMVFDLRAGSLSRMRLEEYKMVKGLTR